MLSNISKQLRRALLGGQQRILGDPSGLSSRILKAVLVLSAMGVVAAAYTLLIQGVDPTRSSYGATAPLFKVATSVWAYVVIEVLLLRSILYISNSRKAQQSAQYLGMTPEEVQLFAAESKSTEGTTRVIATSDDSTEEIRELLLEGMESGEDNVLNREEELETEELQIYTGEEQSVEQAPRWEAQTVQRERASLREILLPAGASFLGAVGSAGVLGALEELTTLSLPSQKWALPVLLFCLGVGLTISRWRGAPVSEEDEEPLPWEARIKLWRMDTAAALQSGDLLWQFAAPAALTSFVLILAAGIWLQWWVYPLLLLSGAFVGSLNYARIRRSRSKELRKLRADSEPNQWDACSVLVKGPITGDTTEMCYAWFEGRGYAANSPRELSREIAPRVHALLHQQEVEPSVLEKYHRNISDMYPDLEGWRRNVEEHRISEALVQRIEQSPNGIIPLAMLIEDVVQWDLEPQLLGLTQSGMGYDPALVRECYQQLHPFAIVEQRMEVQTADGGTEEITAVRLRTEPLPANLSEVRAQFSSRFRAYAQFEPLYELPETDDSEEILLPTPAGASR